MSIPKNYFRNLFGKLNIDKEENGAAVKIRFERMGKNVDIAQDVLDAQVWNDMQKYMPIDTGNLIQETNMLNMSTRGEVYTYPPSLDYGHYQYEGWQYVDPKYGVAGFYNKDTGEFWSRKGVEKVKSDKPLFYSNPLAEAHWDEKAYYAHNKEWVKAVKRALRGAK